MMTAHASVAERSPRRVQLPSAHSRTLAAELSGGPAVGGAVGSFEDGRKLELLAVAPHVWLPDAVPAVG